MMDPERERGVAGDGPALSGLERSGGLLVLFWRSYNARQARRGREALVRDDAVMRGSGQAGGSERLLSLDVLRGLSVAGMILVTDPGTYTAVYPPLLHADWRGATATDMIFPTFLFAAGVAIPLASDVRMRRGATRRGLLVQALRRCVLLIVLGLLLNAFPEFRWATLRLPGVLQRIGLCTLTASAAYVLVLRRSLRVKEGVLLLLCVVLLLGYSALVLRVPVPGFGAGHLDMLRSLPAYVDRRVFTVPHLWPYGLTPGVGVTFDPEGLLSTLPAAVNTLTGVMVGVLFQSEGGRFSRRVAGCMLGAGCALVLAGIWLDADPAPLMPMIKKLWTPSFALLSAGVSLCLLCVLYGVIDVVGWRRGWLPLRVFGMNAIVAFTVSGILTASLTVLRVHGGENWHAWLYAHLFVPWAPAKLASLLYGVAIVAVNGLVVGELYRRRIFLRL